MHAARAWWHDVFNLTTLPLLASTAAAGVAGYDAPTRKAMLVYVALDALWVAALPDSVGSPGTILAHHACAWALAYAAATPRQAWWVSAYVLVEFSTAALILKRYTSRVRALEAALWYGIRCMWYPYIWYKGITEGPITPAIFATSTAMVAVQLYFTYKRMYGPRWKRI